MKTNFPTKEHLLDAHKRIVNYIHRTPVLTSTSLNNLTQASLFFKCENFQKAGSFKIRGASNALLKLPESEKEKGVATHYSGNFAQALALAAKLNDTKSYIVMPSDAPKVKKNAVMSYGGLITECEPTLDARESTLAQVVEKTGAIFIHPFNNHDVICGQATACMELLNDSPDLDYIVCPVGGGGLISGTALAAHYFGKDVSVIGAEPENADDAFRSIQAGKILPSIDPKTIADGLKTSLGNLTFPIIQQHVSEIITVSESEIQTAMHLIWERMKIVIEPSSAVTLAAIVKKAAFFKTKKIGLMLSGGNVSF